MAQQDVGAQFKSLYSVSDEVILNNNVISCKNKNDKWHQIGIDHMINPQNRQKTTKWVIKCTEASINDDLMIGIASKDVVSTKGNNHSGQFMFGWVFSCSGHKYHFGNYARYYNQNNKLASRGALKWAYNDKISLIFHDYSMKLCINDHRVNEWKMEKYPKLNEQQLVPVICINGRNGTKCDYLGLSTTANS